VFLRARWGQMRGRIRTIGRKRTEQVPPQMARRHAICSGTELVSQLRAPSAFHEASTLGCTGRMTLGWQNSGSCVRWMRSGAGTKGRAAQPAHAGVLGQMHAQRCMCR
jgi:hypothetical protein